MPNFWQTVISHRNFLKIFPWWHVDSWPKSWLFRTYHLWNSTTKLILNVYCLGQTFIPDSIVPSISNYNTTFQGLIDHAYLLNLPFKWGHTNATVWRGLGCVRGENTTWYNKTVLVPFFTTISAHRHHIEVIKRRNAV